MSAAPAHVSRVSPSSSSTRASSRRTWGGGDAVVPFEIAEVWRAAGGAILFGDRFSKAAQGEASRLAGLFDDRSSAWGHAYDLSISCESIDLQTIS